MPAGPTPAQAIIDLQMALIGLVVELTRLFGLQMARGCTCMSNLQALDVQTSTEVGEKLPIAIVNSLRAAYAVLLENPEFLDSPNIWNKLIHFAYEHTDEETWQKVSRQVAERFKDINLSKAVNALEARQFDFSKRGSRIAVSEISWLTQLLWYSLTYRIPVYPSTSDLAFRLSLFSRNVPPRVGELAQAAETVANYKTLVEQVKKIFRFCDKSMSTHFGDLHLAVAAALGFAFEGYKEKMILFAQEDDDVPDFRSTSPPPPPMALTTNFDMALEHAFDSLAISYHVVFPVFAREASSMNLLTQPSGDSAKEEFVGFAQLSPSDAGKKRLIIPEIIWVVKTVSKEPNCEDCVDWEVWSKEFALEKVEGPIIVKLHGSPLEKIPEKKLPKYRDRYPCVVLPESTYLEMTLQDSSEFSLWISNGLKATRQEQKERGLWFLGYSVSDWNVRLRLYQQLRWTFELSANELPGLFAVNREFDRYQSAVFGRLRVVQRAADLRMVADVVLAMDEIKNYLNNLEKRRS